MSILSRLSDFVSDLRERVEDAYNWLFEYGEAESGEGEIFDEAEDTEDVEREIAELEDEIEEIESQIDDIEETTHNFPDWISQDDIERIIDETGITDYNEMWESEKDEYIPGWRGFEDADEAATEAEEFRQEMQDLLNIPDYLMNSLSDEELLSLSMLTDGSTGLAREFEELSPEEAAGATDAIYRGTFENWETFINSEAFDFIMDRPDLFEVYTNVYGQIEYYEKENTQ